MTLYQIKLLSLGHEKVAEIGRARAAREMDEATQKKRQYLIDWYARRGVNAR